VIRFSALLVALAIGLLIAGVAASSLLMVYVSIAVCAVAALLLAAGVLRHWSVIFGGEAAQQAGSAASGPVQRARAAVPGPANTRPGESVAAYGVLAKTSAARSPRSAAGAGPSGAGPAWAGTGAGAKVPGRGAEPAARRDRGRGEETDQGLAARPPDRTRRPDRRPGQKDPSGRPSRRPADPAPPQVEQPAANRADDLWERVNEELESAGKRDTGALTWPASDFVAMPETPASTEPGPPDAEPLSGLGSGVGSDLWQPAAGWQPPVNPQLRWPAVRPPAEFGARGADEPEPSQAEAAESAAGTPTAGERATAAAATAGSSGPEASEPASDAAAASEAEAQEPTDGAAAASAPAAGGAKAGDGERPTQNEKGLEDGAPEGRALEDSALQDSVTGQDAPVADAISGEETPAGDAPPWTVATWRVGSEDATDNGSTDTESSGTAATEDAAPEGTAEAKEAGPAKPAPPNPAEGWLAAGAIVPDTQAAESADKPGPHEPGLAEKTKAAEVQPAGKAEAEPAAAPGQADVTVVPGVARYHRSGCILIRFLGADDLEIMPRQQAADAGFVPCRACQPDELKTG
jgi:hypothetical protein